MRCGGPGLCSECAADASRARAALAQPSPTLPPFAEKVLAKLRRFYDCAEDFESGGVDIGRHWLDLLTQLGLLNRVQRSPALWEISQQGEDLLGTPHPSPAQAEQAEAERPEVVDFNPYRYHAEKIRQRADGAASAYEAGRSALGYMEDIAESALIVRNGLDELSAQHERIVEALRFERQQMDRAFTACINERDAANARLHEVATACATAEQERDAALAEVKRIKTISDNYYALCVERQQQLDAALAMVSGLRSLLNPILCYVENDIERMRGDRDKSDNKETYDLAISLAMKRLKAAQHAVFTTEPGCNTAVELASHITAQAQHSVPDDVETFLDEVRAELLRARSKFPGDRIMTIALAEEFGELCKAVLDEPAANVRKEAVQTAVMAARVVLDGDGSVTAWRAERGLDPLAAAPGKEGL